VQFFHIPQDLSHKSSVFTWLRSTDHVTIYQIFPDIQQLPVTSCILTQCLRPTSQQLLCKTMLKLPDRGATHFL